MAEIDIISLDQLTLPGGKYVLVLPGWYPTWLDPFAGDFNQRQVRAAGLRVPCVVLYICKDKTGSLSSVEVRYSQLTENIVEILVVYPKSKTPWFDTLRSNILYFTFLEKFSKKIIKKWGSPSLLHSYIVIRGGLAGWWLKKRLKRPLVLTEHWTIYDPADPGYLKKRNIIFRLLVKKVFANIDLFLPVTHNLKEQVYKLVSRVEGIVIPNVVDTEIFYYNQHKKTDSYFRFIHISTMAYQKNPEGLLKAFKAFNQQFTGCVLWMVGPYPPEVALYLEELKFPHDTVRLTGEIPYYEVGAILRESDALVLFSRYENLPCVVLEALCCGVPVISTKVGGVAEVVDDKCGILIEKESLQQLETAFKTMYLDYAAFNKKKIAEAAASRFSYNVVSNEIRNAYEKLIDLS